MNKHLYGCAFLALLCTLSLAGCVVIPTGEEGAVEPEQQKSLQGVSIEEAEKILGTPYQTLALGQGSYRVYKVDRREGVVVLSHPMLSALMFMGGRIWPPVMTGDGPAGFQCVLLEVEGQIVKRVEASLHDKDEEADCLGLIKNNQKIMDEFRQWVAERVGEGDFASPYEQAERLGDANSIRVIGEAGYLSAALDLARQFGGIEPLQRLANDGWLHAEAKPTSGSSWDDGLSAALVLAKEFADPRPLRKYASLGARDAALALAVDYEETTQTLRDLADNGDLEAATVLARYFANPTALHALAVSGSTGAAVELAAITGNVEPLLALTPEYASTEDSTLAISRHTVKLLRSFSHSPETKEAGALAYKVFGRLAIEVRTAEALTWLCIAADLGNRDARYRLGQLYRPWSQGKYELKPNNRLAYMWYTLAASPGERAVNSRDVLLAEMTPEEVEDAMQMVHNWKPGQCPGPSH